MSQPDGAQWRLEDLQRAAAAAEAAALQFRQAAESLQAGHVLLSAAESRLAQDLLRPWLPAPPVAAVPPPPTPASRWTRGVAALRVLGDYLKIVPFGVMVLGGMAYLWLIRWLPGHRASDLWPPEYDPAHVQPLPPGRGYRQSGTLLQDVEAAQWPGRGVDADQAASPSERPPAVAAAALQHAMRPAGPAAGAVAAPEPRAGRAPSGALAADE